MARPPKYKRAKELQEIIDIYFEECSGDKYHVPSKPGLRVRLGICRDTYLEWGKAPHKFSGTIKAANDIIEEAWVRCLTRPQPTGAIFYLKNAFKDDYKDRVEHTGNDGGAIQFVAMPVELLEKHNLKK
jgi:hypothetical protein